MKKFNFTKDVLLFRKREFIGYALIVWVCMGAIVIDGIWLIFLINEYINKKP